MNSFAIRRPRLHCALFVLLLFAVGIPAAHAQTALYGQFSASRFNTDTVPKSNDWGYGGGFGLYSDFYKVPFAKIGVDFRLQFTRPADNTTLFSPLLGPRIALHPKIIPLNPYAEFLFGAGRFTYIGTTDTDYHGPLDDPRCTSEDVDYVLAAVNRWTTAGLTADDVTGTWAGLRPLIASLGGWTVPTAWYRPAW